MHTVLINDSKSGGYANNALYFNQASMWALNHCASYRGYDVVDVSDTSDYWDEIAEYRFDDEQDVTIFTLKWK